MAVAGGRASLRVLPLRSRLEKRPNRFQQMPFPFNQWFPKSLLKYWGMSREAILGHMARRERRASPLWGCKERATPPDGPRWPRPEGCAAFWAVLRCSSVADPRGVCSLVAPCNSPKIDATRHTPIFQQAPRPKISEKPACRSAGAIRWVFGTNLRPFPEYSPRL
jgi:hypothetical protein